MLLYSTCTQVYCNVLVNLFRYTKGGLRRRKIESLIVSTGCNCGWHFPLLPLCWNNHHNPSHPVGVPHQEVQEKEESTASSFGQKAPSLRQTEP